MTWGEELWDQYDSISVHTLRGIDFLEKYCLFIKERCTIELEYASKLRRLVKNHQPKKKEEEEYQFSSCKAFVLVIKEVNDMAGQHELIAENMTAHIVKEISILGKEIKEERKRHLHDGAKLQASMNSAHSQLEKSKKAYEKAFRESDKAQDNYQKADADLNLSRAEVEKSKSVAVSRSQQCEDCKTDYANQLQKTNELQKVHYSTLMPKVFQQLQDMDERRISCLQNFFKQTSDIQRQVLPIINRCLDGILEAAETIDPQKDSLLVIEKYKSGFSPPEDVPFEDLSIYKINESTGPSPTFPTFKSETLKGTISTGKLRKRGGIFSIFSTNKNHVDEMKEDYSDLPPNQRKKKLQQKIEQINNQIQQETSSRDGLKKMKDVYEHNPSMGDSLLVEGQLTENGHRLQKLQAELQKFQGYLADADCKPSTPSVNKKERNSISEESLSRSASDSSVCNPNNNNKALGPPLPAHDSSNSPESGIGTSHTSIPDEEPNGEYYNAEYQEFDEPLSVIGTAKALYAFDASSEGSIPMSEGEVFDVVELDQGDGWTRVRKSNLEEGFVPTSYIESSLYNSC